MTDSKTEYVPYYLQHPEFRRIAIEAYTVYKREIDNIRKHRGVSEDAYLSLAYCGSADNAALAYMAGNGYQLATMSDLRHATNYGKCLSLDDELPLPADCRLPAEFVERQKEDAAKRALVSVDRSRLVSLVVTPVRDVVLPAPKEPDVEPLGKHTNDCVVEPSDTVSDDVEPVVTDAAEQEAARYAVALAGRASWVTPAQFRELREKLGWTYAHLARVTGYSVKALRRAEVTDDGRRGRKVPQDVAAYLLHYVDAVAGITFVKQNNKSRKKVTK